MLSNEKTERMNELSARYNSCFRSRSRSLPLASSAATCVQGYDTKSTLDLLNPKP